MSMACRLVLLSATCLYVGAVHIAEKQKASGNSMIAKVIEMLGEEKDKIKADLGTEEKTMDEYMQWCDDTQTELSYGIKSAVTKLEDLTATITDNSAQIDALDEEEGAALVQKASASPAASFDAFLQINSNKKSTEEMEADEQTKFAKVQKALTIMVNTFWKNPNSK